MRAMVALSAAMLLMMLWAVAPVASTHAPSTTTHYFSRINAHHANPTDMDVIIIPPGYFSSTAHLGSLGWIGPDALWDAPGTQAVLEATEYWAYMIDSFEDEYPQLENLTYEVTVLGVNAGVDDLNDAEVLITTAMAGDPSSFIFHLGVGLPTVPTGAFTNPGNVGMTLCTTWNTGLGSQGPDVDPLRLRNLAIHEFGHCLAAGHTGGEGGSGSSICNVHGSCYPVPYESGDEDVMSSVNGFERQCISNLNVQGLAEAYDFLPGTWDTHDRETYMPFGSYDQICMPGSMARF